MSTVHNLLHRWRSPTT